MRMIDVLVRYLVETQYDNLSTQVVETTKKQILDTLAASIGGSSCNINDEISNLAKYIRDKGGKPESTLIGFRGRVPAPDAAFLNGILAVRLDFDDTLVKGSKIHISRSVIPPAFAIAERITGVNGREFLTAVALAHDLSARLRQAVGKDIDSPFGMLTNFFGASAVVNKIMGLDREHFTAALSLVFHMISGAQGGRGTAGAGASIKGLNNGLAAQTGVNSGLFAQMGFSASQDLLEPVNKKNLYNIFYQGFYYPEILTDDLGKKFYGLYTSQKEYPCCHGQHASIEATLQIINENHIQSNDIDQVTLRISPGDYDYLVTPAEKKQNPQNLIEAQFSLYWGVASAIVLGGVTINNFTRNALDKQPIRQMISKIVFLSDPDMNTGDGFTPVLIELKTKDGKVYNNHLDHPFGSPEHPMSYADIADKFEQCSEYSVNPISQENQKRIIDLVYEIEAVKDVSLIMELLN